MSRRLTDAYFSIRQNLQQSRENALLHYQYGNNAQDAYKPVEKGSCPEWVFVIEEVRYVLKTMDYEMGVITDLYNEHLSRPSFNDDIRLTTLIDRTYRDITKKIEMCYEKTNQIRKIYMVENPALEVTHQKILQTAISYIFNRVRDYSASLGTQNKHYQQRLKKINTDNMHYFEVPMEKEIVAVHQPQLFQTSSVEQCEKIASSVMDINQIVRDLSLMVHEQGSIIDRVDHHVELASAQVEASLKNLISLEKQLRIPPWKIGLAMTSIFFIVLMSIVIYLKL